MTIGILLIIIVIFLGWGLDLYYEYRRSDYEREFRKAIKDMEKGITTVITDEPNGAFSVEKYKDGKKL